MEFTSNWKEINAPAEKVFAFLSDLQNLGQLMPEQVINWKAGTDTCSFTIQGMTDLNLKIQERTPNSIVSLIPDGKAPFSFSLSSHIRENGEKSEVNILLDADLNPMLAMMAKRPLQNLVNIMADKLAAQH